MFPLLVLLALGCTPTDPLPAPQLSLLPSAPTTTDTLVVALQDPAAASVRWTVDGVAAGGGALIPAQRTRRGQTWRVEVQRHRDSRVSPISIAEVTIANSLPQIAAVRLLAEGSGLRCSWSPPIDADDDPVSVEVSWSDGVSHSAQRPNPPGAPLSCSVTPDDGTDRGRSITSAARAPGNQPPRATQAQILPTEPDTTTPLVCLPLGDDPDGDAISWSFAWQVGGQAAGSGDTLPAGLAHRDQAVRCVATPSDDSGTGSPASAQLWIGDAAPSVSGLTLPSDASVLDPITVSYSLDDPDGDVVVASFAWWVDGQPQPIQGDTLPAGLARRDQEVRVAITPFDGVRSGVPGQASALVVNAPPGAPTVTLSPAEPQPGQALSCIVSADAQDPDGDNVFYSISWQHNGQVASAPGPGQTRPLSSWACRYTPSDGRLLGPEGWASVVLPPSIDTRIAVIGDYGDASTEAAEVAAMVRDWAPDWVLTTGDNNLGGAASTLDAQVGRDWHSYIAPYSGAYGAGASSNRFLPCLGEQDWAGGSVAPYVDFFNLPGNERYWQQALPSLRVLCVDSQPDEPDGIELGSTQADWLQSALDGAGLSLVLLHHPPLSSASGLDPALRWPLADWGADLVISGHDHLYERLWDGIPYLISGNSGRPLDSLGGADTSSELASDAVHGALRLDVGPDGLWGQALGVDGSVLDRFTVLDSPEQVGLLSLDVDASWRWHRGSDLSWVMPGALDADWPSGPGPLGLSADSRTAVELGPSGQIDPTTSYRTLLLLPDELQGGRLELQVDDGVTVWLDGAEVYRANVRQDDGYAPSPLASAWQGRWRSVRLHPARLWGGVHTLAVRVHQAGPDDGSQRFAARLLTW